MPLTIVNDLTYHTASRTLVAATFGRSMLSYDLDGVTSTSDPLGSADQRVNVYPNPAKSQVTIEFQDYKDDGEMVEIYDQSGRMVMSSPLADKRLQLDISSLPAGTYVARVVSVNYAANQLFMKVD